MFEQRPLSTLIERQVGGGTPPRSNPAFWSGPIPWASVKDFEDASLTLSGTAERISQSALDASTANLIPAGIPLVCTRMAVGRCAIATQPVAINQDVRALTPKTEVQPRYLLRLLHFLRSAAESQAVGSTVKGIRTSDYLAIKVPVAPALEQPVIARILDTLDTQIEKTQALIAKLEQVKQGLLHDLLTRGVDENGELRPSAEDAPELYKASPLGLIPKWWGEATARFFCTLITKGTTPAASKMRQGDGDVRFLRVENLTADGQFESRAADVFVSRSTHRGELARSACLPGDVLTNIVGPPLGKLGLVTERTGEVNVNQAIALFRPRASLLPAFLLLWLGSTTAQTWLRRRAKQTSGQVNLTLALCQELPFPDILLHEQEMIVARAAGIDRLMSSAHDELAKLLKAKSGLMDDLLTGRVRVTPLLDPQETPATV